MNHVSPVTHSCPYYQAAQVGNAEAQYRYALFLHQQKGEALMVINWLRRAAQQHHALAELFLGKLYGGQLFEASAGFKNTSDENQAATNPVINQDWRQSKYWFKRAVRHGCIIAYELLGDVYWAQGDMKKAQSCYQNASHFDHTPSMFKMACLIQSKHCQEPNNTVLPILSDCRIKFSNEEALKWLTLAAELGNGQAQYCLAMHIKQQNQTDAALKYESLLRASARNGHKPSYLALGDLFFAGFNTIDQDYLKAMTWYLLAAQYGEASAYLQLSKMYREGLGIKKNLAKAEKFSIEGAWL